MFRFMVQDLSTTQPNLTLKVCLNSTYQSVRRHAYALLPGVGGADSLGVAVLTSREPLLTSHFCPPTHTIVVYTNYYFMLVQVPYVYICTTAFIVLHTIVIKDMLHKLHKCNTNCSCKKILISFGDYMHKLMLNW